VEDGAVSADPTLVPVLPPEVTARWQARFRAPRVSLPHWAQDAPHRNVYSSDLSGVVEQYAWDRETDEHRQVTDRPNGTLIATLSRTARRSGGSPTPTATSSASG
jgi:hypothetical protein